MGRGKEKRQGGMAHALSLAPYRKSPGPSGAVRERATLCFAKARGDREAARRKGETERQKRRGREEQKARAEGVARSRTSNCSNSEAPAGERERGVLPCKLFAAATRRCGGPGEGSWCRRRWRRRLLFFAVESLEVFGVCRRSVLSICSSPSLCVCVCVCVWRGGKMAAAALPLALSPLGGEEEGGADSTKPPRWKKKIPRALSSAGPCSPLRPSLVGRPGCRRANFARSSPASAPPTRWIKNPPTFSLQPLKLFPPPSLPAPLPPRIRQCKRSQRRQAGPHPTPPPTPLPGHGGWGLLQ